MRPISLTIEGINSFIEPQTVDFERLGANNLFCISGVTGSGKTTVLDCIILALYNNHSSRGKLPDYINLRCEKGQIEFKFELAGEIYITRRIISRKVNKNSFLLMREGDITPVAEGNNAYAYLQERIGLTVDEFTNVVVLQQGEFAKFLKATKSDRVKLISKLFDLGRFEDLYTKFNKKATEAQAKSEACQKALEGYDAVSDEMVKELSENCEKLKTEVGVCRGLVVSLRETAEKRARQAEEYKTYLSLKGEIEECEKITASFTDRERARDKMATELNAREEKLKAEEKGRDALVERLAQIARTEEALSRNAKKAETLEKEKRELDREKEAIAQREREVENAERDAKKTADKIKELKSGLKFGWSEDEEGDITALLARATADKRALTLAATALAAARKERSECEREVELKQEEWKRLQLAHSLLLKKAEESKQRALALAREYEDALEGNAVACILSRAKAGDKCPVCGGVISENEHAEQADIESKKLASERALSESNEDNEKLNKSQVLLSALGEKILSLNGLLEEKKKKESEALGEVTALERSEFITGEALILELSERVKELKRANEKIRELRADKERAQAALLERERSIVSRGKELDEESLLLREVAGKPGEREEKKALLEEMSAKREKLDADKAAFDSASKRLESDKSEITGRLNGARAKIKESAPVTDEEVSVAKKSAEAAEVKLNELTARCAAIEKELELTIVRLEEKKKLLEQKRGYDKEYDRYGVMRKLFLGNAFAEFVAAEYIREFTYLASERLGELTNGKYSLGYDENSGEFFVLDFLSGNEKRGVKTLSGGETFLASLSLAIAISRELSRDKNYEFFFIDEGFGTLSGEALDMVTDALKKLARDTLVGVITHRGELIERIDSVLFVTQADGEEGSTVTHSS